MAGSGGRGDAAGSAIPLVGKDDGRAFPCGSDGRPGPRKSAADDQHIGLETFAGFDGGHAFDLRTTGRASLEPARIRVCTN